MFILIENRLLLVREISNLCGLELVHMHCTLNSKNGATEGQGQFRGQQKRWHVRHNFSCSQLVLAKKKT